MENGITMNSWSLHQQESTNGSANGLSSLAVLLLHSYPFSFQIFSTLLKPLICLLCLPAPLGPHHHYQNQHRSFHTYLLSTYKPGPGILWAKHAETFFLHRLWSTNKESLVCQVVISQWKLKQVMGGRKRRLLPCFLDRRVRESTWHWVQMSGREGSMHVSREGKFLCRSSSKY